MTGRPGSSGDEGPIGRSGPDAEYVMLWQFYPIFYSILCAKIV